MNKICRQSLALVLLVVSALACSKAAPASGVPIKPATTRATDQAPSHAQTTITIGAQTQGDSAVPPTLETILPPNPLAVRITQDSTLRSTATITESGGTISARAPDGTRFQLEVPAGAVDQATEITLTPMISVEGLPLSGGFVAGVNLEPDGLQFARPITLTIETAQSLGPSQYEPVAFSAQGDGQEFFLYPSRTEGRRTTMLLAHFSSRGLAKGTLADIAKQKREHSPSRPMDRLQQDLAGQQEHAALVKQMTNAYLFIESNVNNAQTGAELEAANQAFADWLSALDTLDLWDDLKENFDLLQSLFAVRVHDLIARLALECVELKDLTRINELLKWYRRALPGSGWSISYWIAEDTQKRMENAVYQCLSFDLEFESTIRRDFSLFNSTYSARATIHLRLAEGGRGAAGTAPMQLNLKEEANTQYLLILGSGAQGGDLSASVDLFGRKSNTGNDFSLGEIVLALNPGQDSRYSLQMACSPFSCGPETINREPMWKYMFLSLHGDEGRADGIEIRGWTVTGPGTARKLYSRSKQIGPGSVHEYTSLWLTHAAAK